MRILMIVLSVVVVISAVSAGPRVGALSPGQAEEASPLLEVRARESLRFGRGESSGGAYFDVPIVGQADQGVLIKLGYTQRGGELSFDLHHRAALSQEFSLPAELMTVVDVISGSSAPMGTFTLLSTLGNDAAADEEIDRASDAEVDRYVSPLGRRRITIRTDPGPQSLSIVGRELTISREGFVTHIDTPGTRIAMVSNIRFVETREGETLSFENEGGDN
jgi:hypothetical protein